MAYTTVNDVRGRLPLITAEVRTDDQVADFITQAGATVDAALRGLYRLPLAGTLDPLVAFVALDLACGLLLENVFGEETPNDVALPATLKARATKVLDAVRDGSIVLEHEAAAAPGCPSWDRPSLGPGDEETSAFTLGPRVLDGTEEE